MIEGFEVIPPDDLKSLLGYLTTKHQPRIGFMPNAVSNHWKRGELCFQYTPGLRTIGGA